MEKTEVLANLYSLKAGLCLIDEERELVVSKENEYKNYEAQLLENSNEQNSLNDQIKNQLDQIDRAQDNINKIETTYRNQVEEITSVPNNIRFHSFFNIGVLLFMILFFVRFITNLLEMEGTIGENSTWIKKEAIIVALLFTVLEISIIMNSLKKSKFKKEKKSRLKSAKYLYQNDIAAANRQLINTKAILKKHEEELAVLKNRRPVLDNYKTAAKMKFDDVAKIHIPISESIYNSLIEKYSALVVPEDWELLDLIIYSVYSGRADTIKEALEYADKQRSVDNLINAIGVATAHIAKTLERSVFTLQANLRFCIDDLKAEISKQTNKIVSSNQRIASEIDELRKTTASEIASSADRITQSLGSIKTESEKQSQLMQSMKKSSLSLSENMEYFRNTSYQSYR